MGVELLQAFRPRDGEPGTVFAPESLRELLSFREPKDGIGRAIRRAQLDALVRLVPATVSAQLLAAGLVAFTMRPFVADRSLLIWFGLVLALCVLRGARAFRIRIDPDYAARKPPRLVPIVVILAMLATLWLVPPVFWFSATDTEHQMMLGVLVIALMSAGSVSLASVPQASLAYLLILSLGGVVMTSQFESLVHVVLMLLFTMVLCFAALVNARRFIGHVRTQYEMQEQSELISLLREFEASGSDWLWQLDRDLRLTYMSRAMADAIGRPLSQLIGMHASRIIDPDGNAVQLSAGMRRLMHHAGERSAFRDIAIPVDHGRRWWSISAKPLFDADGRFQGWRGVGSDITDIRLSGSDSVRAARLDPLTGVANRLLLREQLEEALLRQLGGDCACALLLVDLDRFKLVNDTLGHSVGDQLLCEVARRLESCVGSDGVVGRLGGDEFAVVWRGAGDAEALSALAARLIAELSRTISIGAADLHIGATIGIARAPRDGSREEVLMRCADLALYSGKDSGRGGHAFFQQQMYVDAEDYRSLESDVRNALGSDGLELHYQPIIDARSGRLVGREALLRWSHPQRGPIPPDQFVPIIEDAGLIHQIGDWVIREACAEAIGWPSDLRVAVNISAAQLSGHGIAETVLGALAATGLEPGRLELEVTESIFIGDDVSTLAALERLRGIGVRLVLDDFGKGYSSFGYLSRAQFSKIKIDRSFVAGAAEGERDCGAIVRAILALARGLNVETTAEGVESEREAAVMRALGCDQLQGYLFGRPVPAAELGEQAENFASGPFSRSARAL
ncbi:MAG TPA: EAL domain-containing protein [Sphingomicrobium sp.]|nr:EAL domain-containing protein [Sphingomicrobium sp.]